MSEIIYTICPNCEKSFKMAVPSDMYAPKNAIIVTWECSVCWPDSYGKYPVQCFDIEGHLVREFNNFRHYMTWIFKIGPENI